MGLGIPKPKRVQNLIQPRRDNRLLTNRWRPEKSSDNSANKLLLIITQKRVRWDLNPKETV